MESYEKNQQIITNLSEHVTDLAKQLVPILELNDYSLNQNFIDEHKYRVDNY